MILRDLAPALRPLLVALSIAIFGPSCKRGAQDGADASTDGAALPMEGGRAQLLGDAAPTTKAAGSGELQQTEPTAPASPASFGDLVCIGRAAGGKSSGAAPRPPPPPRAGRGGGSSTPLAHPKHALEIDHPIEFKILHRSMCFSGSCSTAPATCTATRRGFTITLNARVPSPTTPPTQPCTAECPPAIARCQSDSLHAGTYTVELEGRKQFVQIPSLSPPPCAN